MSRMTLCSPCRNTGSFNNLSEKRQCLGTIVMDVVNCMGAWSLTLGSILYDESWSREPEQ